MRSNIIFFPINQQLVPQQPEQQQNKTNETSTEEATHWIPREINQHCEGNLTLGEPYKILYDEMRDEFYMLDDCGANTVWFLVIKGDFFKI